ncbi:MAG TPA: Spy/CpxP family protein refolding chaperone [Gemmatimonadaceae bacterium]|jgi:Spy/CpxP family protein refolding chaperone|nr:Spy/CpxP family protein refolding chaperone [Gemmatimonadaceae bacterium]
MSSVRALALGALMIVGVAGVSAAQSTTTPPSRGQRSGEMRRGSGGREFGRDLNLTDAQKAQIKAIRAKYQPQNEALRNQAKPFTDAAKAARQKGDTVAFRSNMEKAHQVMLGGQSFRTQQNAEIRAILTPDQQAKFDARQKNMAERGKGDHKGWGKKKAPAAKS